MPIGSWSDAPTRPRGVRAALCAATILGEVSAPTGQAPRRPAEKAPNEKRRPRRELARSALILVLAGLILAFAIANLKQVEVDWLFGSGHAPLIIVIAISLVVGILLSHFTGRLARWRR